MFFKTSPNNATQQHPKPVGEEVTQPTNLRKFVRYTMTPEIMPRIRKLGIHFGHFAYLIALVFSSARLIPQAHPALNAANIGRFGVRQVIAIAANNLTWSRRNVDQIAIFSAIVIGIIMIVIQIGLIAFYAMLGGEAQAQTGFFETPNQDQDLAHIFLSQVFGTELGLFGSGDGIIGTTGNPLHTAMRGMLKLYSMATMVIAVIIVLYFILTVIGEAAKTGTPFGSRFNSLWAPIRLVVALGLLVPLGSGLNSAQYITLWMAKMGSGLGTQVWLIVGDVIKNSPATVYNVKLNETLFLHNMVENAFIAAVCAKAHTDHELTGGGGSWDKLLMSGDTSNSFMYMWRGPDSAPHHRRSCGTVSVSFPDNQEHVDMGENVFGLAARVSAMPVGLLLQTIKPIIDKALNDVEDVAATYTGGLEDQETITKLRKIAEDSTRDLTKAVSDIYTNQVSADLKELMSSMDDKGWLYSGVWYMQLNRTMQAAYQQRSKVVPGVVIPQKYSTPESSTWWEYLTDSYTNADARVSAAKSLVNTYGLTPSWASRTADALKDSYDKSCMAAKRESGVELPIMEKLQCIIASTFVPEELTALSKQPTLDPMGVLVSAGGSILSRAYELAVWGFGAKVAGGIFSGLPIVGGVGAVAAEIGGMLITIAFIGFGAGVILYFLLPIFPFMYFFFAVVGWVMEIFEAIVAMPLWALAHLRINGDGMPGEAAMTGYYLLLAILLRPALIIFGLIGSSLIFFASIFLLQILFTPLLEVTQEDGMYGLEIVLFTIIFAYIAYMLGLSCFKMVDTIPNAILRWIGSGAQTFGDNREDSIHGAQTAFLGGAVLGQQAAGGIGGLGSAAGQATGRGLMGVGRGAGRGVLGATAAMTGYLAGRKSGDDHESDRDEDQAQPPTNNGDLGPDDDNSDTSQR
ncbi:MAG: hypothetical protein COA52_11530 [Hyphomicrobiales bacterium]|nr:MAG: hypothetical protein COA52_11530 [Hyphomicrobiales bacterium]